MREVGVRLLAHYHWPTPPRVKTNMSSKTISVNVPAEMLPEIDEAARHEKRSRSEFIREALRRYLSCGRGRLIPLDDARPDEIEAIERARAEFARGDFVRLEDLQRELGLPPK